jgi:hypothetical protein
MTLYFEGHQQAQHALSSMDEQELYEVLDGLYGRAGLSDDPTLDELQQEASRQVRKDFTNPECDTHRQVAFWVKIVEATRNSGC